MKYWQRQRMKTRTICEPTSTSSISISHNVCLRATIQFTGGQDPQILPKFGQNRHFPTTSVISWNRNIAVTSERIIYAISGKNLFHQGERRGRPKTGVKHIQDGGRLPSWKYINRCISAITGLICTKFGLQIDICHTRAISMSVLVVARKGNHCGWLVMS